MSKKSFYFPHDYNARNDEKILALRMDLKAEGYGIYFMLLEKLLESDRYILLKDYNRLAFDLRVSAENIKKVVENYGLFQFTEDGKLFYSESLRLRMQPLDNLRKQRSEAGKKSAEKRQRVRGGMRPLQKNSTTVERPLQKNSTDIVKESKVNEKENDTKENKGLPYGDTPTKSFKEFNEKEFYETLIPFVKEYGKEMIRSFYDYWTEKNASGKKMRFQLEKTWETAKRLSTWDRNESKFNKEKPQNKVETPKRKVYEL